MKRPTSVAPLFVLRGTVGSAGVAKKEMEGERTTISIARFPLFVSDQCDPR